MWSGWDVQTERCLRFWRPGQKISGIFSSKFPTLCWPLQSYPSSGSDCATIKKRKDLYSYGSNTKLDLLSFQFVLFLKRNKMYKEMCFEAESQMSVTEPQPPEGAHLGQESQEGRLSRAFPSISAGCLTVFWWLQQKIPQRGRNISSNAFESPRPGLACQGTYWNHTGAFPPWKMHPASAKFQQGCRSDHPSGESYSNITRLLPQAARLA